MERLPRFELGHSRWQRGRLPLHHSRILSSFNSFVNFLNTIHNGITGINATVVHKSINPIVFILHNKWCLLRDSNSRPTDYKSVALPTVLNRQINFYIFILKPSLFPPAYPAHPNINSASPNGDDLILIVDCDTSTLTCITDNIFARLLILSRISVC